MDRSRTIKFAAGEVDSLANYIQRKYYSKGFQTQKTPFEENGIPGLMVQIRNTADDLGGKVKDNQHKYTYAVVGYLPADKPRYILLLTAYDFTKSSGSIQGISFLRQQWKNLETKFNSMMK